MFAYLKEGLAKWRRMKAVVLAGPVCLSSEDVCGTVGIQKSVFLEHIVLNNYPKQVQSW